jgi:hypothetical protein
MILTSCAYEQQGKKECFDGLESEIFEFQLVSRPRGYLSHILYLLIFTLCLDEQEGKNE